MKKTLFTLMISTFAIASVQPSQAGKIGGKENRVEQLLGVVQTVRFKRELPRPDFSNTTRSNRVKRWVPQAPINQAKNPGTYARWVLRAKNNPGKYRFDGINPEIFQ